MLDYVIIGIDVVNVFKVDVIVFVQFYCEVGECSCQC